MIETRGAPWGQGLDQARALGDAIRESVVRLRGSHGWLEWRRELRAAHRGTGRALSRFVPQLHERLQGMARGAGVDLAALELGESLHRSRVAGGAKGARIEGALEVPAAVALVLRRSEPDAGGFPSVELTSAVFGGALCGVNAEGIAAAAIDDGPLRAPPVRTLVQDVLFRTRSFASAIDHLRRRAHYLASSGALLVSSFDGECARVELRGGWLALHEPEFASSPSRLPSLVLDAEARELVWRREGGDERAAALA